MSDRKTPGDIALRFNTELLQIQRYLAFVKSKSDIDLRQVLDLNKVLQQHSLRELPIRSYLGIDQRLTLPEVQKLVPAILQITPQIDKQMSALNSQVDANLPFAQGAEFDQGTLGEWIHYFMDRVTDSNPDADMLGQLRRAAMEAARREGGQSLSELEIGKYVDVAIRYAIHYLLSSRLAALQAILDRFEEMKTIAAAASDNAVTDIMRQGFIVLMAAFDAAVFDLVRYALRKRFFDLAPAFGNKDKFSIAEIAEFGSFEKLRDEIIETQLTRRYIKGVLALLADTWKVECVNKADGQKFGRLIEIVLRRNVHLHNRGVIDEFYLNQKYNLDGFKLDDSAKITEEYWQQAKEYCTFCVRQVAIWADG